MTRRKDEIQKRLEWLHEYFKKSFDQSVHSCEWDTVNPKLEKLMSLAIDIWEDHVRGE